MSREPTISEIMARIQQHFKQEDIEKKRAKYFDRQTPTNRAARRRAEKRKRK